MTRNNNREKKKMKMKTKYTKYTMIYVVRSKVYIYKRKHRRISTIVKGDHNLRVLKSQSLNYTQKDTSSLLVKISFNIYIYF